MQDGTPYTQRIIRSIDLDIGNGMANATAQGKSSNLEANRGQSERFTDAFGRRLGVQGHINALLSNNSIIDQFEGIKAEDIAGVVRLAIAIEDEAERQLNPSPGYEKFKSALKPVSEESQTMNEPEPDVPDFADEDLGKDIPF